MLLESINLQVLTKQNIASKSKRLLAFIIDIFIWSLVSIMSGVKDFKKMYFLGYIIVPRKIELVSIFHILLFLFYLYMWSNGTSIGKKLLGIKVYSCYTGKTLNPVVMFFRETILKTLSSIFFGIGFLWIFFDKHNQCLHDKIANSLVVNETQLNKIKNTKQNKSIEREKIIPFYDYIKKYDKNILKSNPTCLKFGEDFAVILLSYAKELTQKYKKEFELSLNQIEAIMCYIMLNTYELAINYLFKDDLDYILTLTSRASKIINTRIASLLNIQIDDIEANKIKIRTQEEKKQIEMLFQQVVNNKQFDPDRAVFEHSLNSFIYEVLSLIGKQESSILKKKIKKIIKKHQEEIFNSIIKVLSHINFKEPSATEVLFDNFKDPNEK